MTGHGRFVLFTITPFLHMYISRTWSQHLANIHYNRDYVENNNIGQYEENTLEDYIHYYFINVAFRFMYCFVVQHYYTICNSSIHIIMHV